MPSLSRIPSLFESKNVNVEIKQGKPRHPWVNGQSERTIRTLSAILNKSLTHIQVSKLLLDEFQVILELTTSIYNNSCFFYFLFILLKVHSTINMTPNEAWNGIVSRALLLQQEDEVIVPQNEEQQEVIVQQLQEKLLQNHVCFILFFVISVESSSRKLSQKSAKGTIKTQ